MAQAGSRLSAWRTALERWRRPRSPCCILMYHGVVPDGTQPCLWTQIEASLFEAQMRYLHHHRRVVPLAQLLLPGAQACLEPGTIAVTFDDGYQNNLDVAMPILERFGIPATVFVTAGLIGTDDLLWSDQVYDRLVPLYDPGGRRLREAYAFVRTLKQLSEAQRRIALRERLDPFGGVPVAGRGHPRRLLDVPSLRKLAASPLVHIGSHGMTHALLTRVPENEAQRELIESKAALEKWTGQAVDMVAYPDGACDRETIRLARNAGYRAGVTTAFRRLRPGDDPMTLGRYPVGSDIGLRRFVGLLSGRLEARHRARAWVGRVVNHGLDQEVS